MPVNLCIFYTTWLSQPAGYNRPVAEKVLLPCSDRQSAFNHKGVFLYDTNAKYRFYKKIRKKVFFMLMRLFQTTIYTYPKRYLATGSIPNRTNTCVR